MLLKQRILPINACHHTAGISYDQGANWEELQRETFTSSALHTHKESQLLLPQPPGRNGFTGAAPRVVPLVALLFRFNQRCDGRQNLTMHSGILTREMFIFDLLKLCRSG
jgi:hypothetical protein